MHATEESETSAQHGRRVFQTREKRPPSLTELARPRRPPAMALPVLTGLEAVPHFGVGRATSQSKKMQLLRSGVAMESASGWYLPRKQVLIVIAAGPMYK